MCPQRQRPFFTDISPDYDHHKWWWLTYDGVKYDYDDNYDYDEKSMTMWNNKAGARAALGHISSLAFSDDMSAHLFPFHMMKYDDDVDDTYDDDDKS